jgi:hypothetical protein
MKGFAVVAIAAVCILETSGCASEHYATHPRGSPQDLLAIMTKEDVIAPADSGVADTVIPAIHESCHLRAGKGSAHSPERPILSE